MTDDDDDVPPDPVHFLDKDRLTGWGGTMRDMVFDKQATLSRDAAEQILWRYTRFVNAVHRLAWNPRSTREELRALVEREHD